MYNLRKIVQGLDCQVVIQGELESPVECSMSMAIKYMETHMQSEKIQFSGSIINLFQFYKMTFIRWKLIDLCFEYDVYTQWNE